MPRAVGSALRFHEWAFHEWLERTLTAGRGGLLPMGDDVAAIAVGRETLLLTTDALSEGSHFLPQADPRQIGRAAVAVSLSDIASKGGSPLAVLIDLLMPPRTPMRWAQQVLQGAEGLARRYGCHVVGGDTKAAAGRSVVGTIIARAPRGSLPARSAARPGDALIVTGSVGRGGRAAWPILAGRRLGTRERANLLAIEPRVREGKALARFARAMLDTSDGLADAARRLAHASRVRVVLDMERLPLDRQLDEIRPTKRRLAVAMYGGDYELLAAVPPAVLTRALRSIRSLGGPATPIGWVETGRGAFLIDRGRLRPLPKTGWDPFHPPAALVRRSRTPHSPR